MPNPAEEALRDLLRQARGRDLPTEAADASQPALNTMAVVSAAWNTAGTIPAVSIEDPYVELLRDYARYAATGANGEPVFNLTQPIPLSARVEPVPVLESPISHLSISTTLRETPAELPDISSLFMGGREAQDAASVMGVDDGLGDDLQALHGFQATDSDISFDADELGDYETAAPNPATRFQIGRQSPPPINFGRETSSSDGEIVSQRSTTGRFTPLRRAVSRAEAVARPTSEPSRRAPQTQPIPAKLPKSPPVSVYARLGKVLPDD